jgi:integrase/recombinase XerD
MKSTRNFNEENERVKRAYLNYLRLAKGYANVSVDKAADALLRFETAIGMKPFRNISIEDARRFKDALDATISTRTGKPISAALRVNVLNSVRAFVTWLADRPGYKSSIRHSDADYFAPTLKDARIAQARRPIPHPSPEQVLHTFHLMPVATIFERRNKALFAMMMLTGARIAAAATLTIGHVDLVAGSIFQDGRDMKTKFSKSFTTWFLPIDQIYLDCLTAWIEELRVIHLFSSTDPLFPRPKMQVSPVLGFQCVGLTRTPYSSEDSLRKFIKEAFSAAGLPPFTPHRFRNTLVQMSNSFCSTPEQIKAISMNLGHEKISTTIDDYGRLSPERQGEVIKAMRSKAKDKTSNE